MKILQGLNPEQKRAVTHKNGPLVIVAGAGTGKTTVITRRLAYLIESKLAGPDNILALTFTDKAAREMEERVDQLLPYGYVDLWVSTFHSFCERVLKDYALDIGVPQNFKILDETQSWLLARRNFDLFTLDYYKPLGNPTKFLQALIRHFSRAKDENISPKEYLDYAKGLSLNTDTAEVPAGKKGKSDEELKEIWEAQRISEIANAYHVYQKILLDNSALDFGDLIYYTLKLFRARPQLLKKYQQQFKYVLVDEFQDTNIAQYELVKLLSGPDDNLTMVGDDDQSIYAFRGASMSNILEFKKDYPDSAEVVLCKNYRSKQNILDLAYNFIQLNNPNRLEFQLKNGAKENIKELQEEIKKKGQVLKSEISKKLQSQNKGPGQIEHLHFISQDEEAVGIVQKIVDLKTKTMDTEWSDFAILVRANDQADVFVRILENQEIPYQFLASKGLFSQPEILDLVAYLRLLDNYHESSALFRVMNISTLQVHLEDIMQLTNWSYRKGISLYESLKQARTLSRVSEKGIKSIEKILGLIEKHSMLARDKTVGQVLFAFLEDSGLIKEISKKDDQKSREKILNINTFFRRVSAFEQSHEERSVQDFMRDFELTRESGESGSMVYDLESEGPEAVKIMTAHGAKGLEFEYVFIPQLVDKRFPSTGRREPIELPDDLIKEIIPVGDVHLQEERRLFYVAITRAKQGVFFASAEDYGGRREKKPSRFLTEAGLIKELPLKAKKSTGEVFFRSPKREAQSAKLQLKAQSLAGATKAFSFTKFRAYETCPYQYRFAHILKLPIPGRPSFSFGKTIHNTLYHFFKLLDEKSRSEQKNLFGEPVKSEKNKKVLTCPEQSRGASLDDLLKIYEENWIGDWYENKKQAEENKKRGRELLKKFYESHDGNFPQPKYLEKGFVIRLDKYRVRGFIDRIDIVASQQGKDPSTPSLLRLAPLAQGGVARDVAPTKAKGGVYGLPVGLHKIEIIDYKTGRVPKSKKDIEKDQLNIYALAAREVLKDEPRILTFYYLEVNKKISFAPNDQEIAKTKQKFLQIIKNIEKGDFTATAGFHCQYCDFKEICEFRAK